MQAPVRLKQELELFNVFISSLQPGSGEWKPGRKEVSVLLLCGVSGWKAGFCGVTAALQHPDIHLQLGKGCSRAGLGSCSGVVIPLFLVTSKSGSLWLMKRLWLHFPVWHSAGKAKASEKISISWWA